jgi:hypothetical protein
MAPEPLRYSILGTCVTRDAADVGADPLPKPVHYFSRTRIQSIVSPPSPIDPAAVTLDSPFQRRVIIEDHDKTTARVLATLDHPLVVDLGDERSPLLRTRTGGLVTATLHFNQLGLGDHPDFVPVQEDWELRDDGPFAEACHYFASRFVPNHPVILHAGYWATHDADGKPVEKIKMAQRYNAWLARAYEIFAKAIGPRIRFVVPPEELRVPDPNHRWGEEPFHFPVEYYDELSRQIREILRPAVANG